MGKINISILIANFNGEKYLDKCLNSCIHQNFKHKYEIILIDDNSTDNSLHIAKKFRNKIKVLKTNKLNNSSKFNTYYQLNTYLHGFKVAKGNIICFLDSDDYFKKNKLSKIHFYFSKNKHLKFLFDTPILVNFKGKINSPAHKYEFRTNKWPKFPPQSCISVKRDAIEKYLKKLFQKKYHLTTLDFRIASLANANKKSTIFLNEKLTYYFQHVDNESNKNFKKFNYNWFKRRLEAIQYYNNDNKIKISLIDYLFTISMIYFLACKHFCKNKIKQYLTKIMLR